MTQAGLTVGSKTNRTIKAILNKSPDDTPRGVSQSAGNELVVASKDKDGAGTKRKFTLDEDEVDRNARQDEAKARKAIEDEKVCIYNPPFALIPFPLY